MSLPKKTIADLLFGVQLVGAVIFCGAQFLRSLEDVHGVSIVQFALATTFVVFNLLLGIGAHRAQPSRVTMQGIVTYIVWVAMLTAVVVAVATNREYRWSIQDSVTLGIAVVLTIGTLGFGALQGRPIRDPMTLAFLAIASKSMPQLLLVWSILEQGGSGIPAASIIVGHCTILIRLGQIYFMVREAGWERNRVWLAVSESAAELTWIATTTAWLVML
ncbi:MAG: hypothetical protein ABA06_01290 [Parcubacteria bacterium C7867-001]|nr:MAG: hypothetical protein ABA06_01290 [Parcubacteria bacterium C7867-001]